MQNRSHTRRGTILLMVVGLLAMLFVIVTAFLALARFDKNTIEDLTVRKNIDATNSAVTDIVSQELSRGVSQSNSAVGSAFVPLETLPNTGVVGPLEPIADWSVNTGPGSDADNYLRGFSGLARMRYAGITRLEKGAPPWAPQLIDLVLDHNENGTKTIGQSGNLLTNDLFWWSHAPWNDADGDGMPDTSFVYTRMATQIANAVAGRAAIVPPLTLPDSMLLAGNGRKVPWRPLFTDPANASASIGGVNPVTVAGVAVGDPPDAADPTVYAWRDYERTAKVVSTVRVVSDGAKLLLSSPGVYNNSSNPASVNRDFAAGMFLWMRNPQDRVLRADSTLWDEIAASASAVQAVLARRGGDLPTEADGPVGTAPQRDKARVVAAVRSLETDQKATFAPSLMGTPGAAVVKQDQWQQWNMVSGTGLNPSPAELNAWIASKSLDPVYSNKGYGLPHAAGMDPDLLYSRRHNFTAVSNSDNAVRPSGARDAWLAYARGLNASDPYAVGTPIGLVEGQTKFYLGQIADPRIWGNRTYNLSQTVPSPAGIPATDRRGAFNADGTFNPVTGARVIRQLADYYFEMLYNYQDWRVLGTGETTMVALRRQALMLAVNSVSFAAPRIVGSAGAGAKVAPVYFADMLHDATNVLNDGLDIYFGYEPQPFITQIVVYGETSRGAQPSDPTQEKTAVAIEFYNPNDPNIPLGGGAATDNHALPLDEYTLTFGDPNGDPQADPNQFNAATISDAERMPRELGTVFSTTAGGATLPGRTFKAVTVRNSSGPARLESNITQMGNGLGADAVASISDMSLAITGGKIRANLWRRVDNFRIQINGTQFTQTPRYYLVDHLIVDISNRSAIGSPNPGQTLEYHKSVERDTRNTINIAGNDIIPYGDYGDPDRTARWSVVTAFEPGNDDRDFYSSSAGAPDLGDVEAGTQIDFASIAAAGPIRRERGPWTPLYMMNANRTTTSAGGTGHTQGAIHGMTRPASYPTVGFMSFIPRFSEMQHVSDLSLPQISLHYTMGKLLRERVGANREFDTLAKVPADFGHMRLLDNRDRTGASTNGERVRAKGYFDKDLAGTVPWGQLVYDYFTTFNAADPNNDDNVADAVDPMKIPGRIDINQAPWLTLAGLPVIGPRTTSSGGRAAGDLPSEWIDSSASPAFWSIAAGVLVGRGVGDVPGYDGALTPIIRSVLPSVNINNVAPPPLRWRVIDATSLTNAGFYPPAPNTSGPNPGTWYRLGSDLAVAVAAYRDRIAYVPPGDAVSPPADRPMARWWDSYRRGLSAGDFDLDSPAVVASTSNAYRDGKYGSMRGAKNPMGAGGSNESRFGFVTLGELLNVKGFDGAMYQPGPNGWNQISEYAGTGDGDFFRAVAFEALLDTQWLTTRSNTFTVYLSMNDRDNPQSSVRAQTTIDRSNTLPRAVRNSTSLTNASGQLIDVDGDGVQTEFDRPYTTLSTSDKPEVVSERRIGYYNARYDD